jgi:dethiobiotin synthetase
VNHTLLTLEAARARRLAVAGVVLCRAVASAGADEPTNPEAIAAYGRVPILGSFPHGTDADDVADRVLDQIQPRAR